MGKVVLRAATLLATAGLVLAAAGAVVAASPLPDTIGGRLSATGNAVSVLNQGSLPIVVTLDAEAVTISPDPFTVPPGESHTVAFTGDPKGRVNATLQGVSLVPGRDTNSVSLSLTLRPWSPPVDYGGALFGILLAIGGGLLMLRVRPWTLRVTRAPVAPEQRPSPAFRPVMSHSVRRPDDEDLDADD